MDWEQALAGAVIRRAIEDLSAGSPQRQAEAREFFDPQRTIYQHWCACAGVDPVWLADRVLMTEKVA